MHLPVHLSATAEVAMLKAEAKAAEEAKAHRSMTTPTVFLRPVGGSHAAAFAAAAPSCLFGKGAAAAVAAANSQCCSTVWDDQIPQPSEGQRRNSRWSVGYGAAEERRGLDNEVASKWVASGEW